MFFGAKPTNPINILFIRVIRGLYRLRFPDVTTPLNISPKNFLPPTLESSSSPITMTPPAILEPPAPRVSASRHRRMGVLTVRGPDFRVPPNFQLEDPGEVFITQMVSHNPTTNQHGTT
jgi:hypothetical protein